MSPRYYFSPALCVFAFFLWPFCLPRSQSLSFSFWLSVCLFFILFISLPSHTKGLGSLCTEQATNQPPYRPKMYNLLSPSFFLCLSVSLFLSLSLCLPALPPINFLLLNVKSKPIFYIHSPLSFLYDRPISVSTVKICVEITSLAFFTIL